MAEDNAVEISFGATITDLVEKVGEASATVKEFAVGSMEQVESLNASIASLHSAFSAIAELAMLGFIGEQLADLGLKVAEYAEQLDIASQKTGVAAEDLAALEYAASTVNVSAQGLEHSLQLLGRNMVNVTDDGGPLSQAFKAVGLSAKEVKDLSLDEVLQKIADRFEHAPDGPEKTALAMALMGRHERMSASRAFDLGLVSEVVPHEQLLERAHELSEVVDPSPLVVVSRL